MVSPAHEHAFLGNGRGAALVDCRGAIDWLCLPRFDSPACFAALLGRPEHGGWWLAPAGGTARTRQRYRGDTLIVDTEMECGDGRVVVSDCMPTDRDCAELVRVVHGTAGRVRMRSRFRPRFGYGRQRPEFARRGGVVLASGDDQAVALDASVPLRIEEDGEVIAEFDIGPGERVTFAMTLDARSPPDPPLDPEAALESCHRWWCDWAARCRYEGPWRDAVVRSLLTLKGLIYEPSGGIVAAPTTSLPEVPGGVRNWDYRYCWLRDAAFSLLALLGTGYRDEARKWRDWLVRSVRDDPFTMHVLYRVDGSTELEERELDWLPGHRDSRPVRIGNGASAQLQLDTRGQVMDVLHLARQSGLEIADEAWDLQVALLDELTERWREPDHGIWEMRGDPAHFVHSKAMAWVAFDRGLRAARERRVDGPTDAWRRTCEAIREDIMRHGFDRERGVFVQRYGAPDLDASLLLLPLVGFVAPDSPEARATTEAIRGELCLPDSGGLLRRYRNDIEVDGLPGHEGAFLPCSFWLVDNLALSGCLDEAKALFERLLTLRNHVGLLAEEWHAEHGVLGNLPLALTHVGLVNSARILADVQRGQGRPSVPTRSDEGAEALLAEQEPHRGSRS
ncbi:glycoside hydrolase family 15 protein [Luteimonas sp. RD2P54]|uniref:Glycoside hydrolase family 15 protein n=1 Tax=Luteimonas endophytica TaxID=3042023 RepID=A0ABT6JDM7_9GAMM|nr:glycoside hydrolase family 15 protein [Luteimonas endophytica]MDH5824920.1 glycoside hydrolase family 15 protein [Luteimonas endophytica]